MRVLQVLEATEGGTRVHLRDLVLGLDPREFELEVAVGLDRGVGVQDDLERFRDLGVAVHVGPMVRSIHPRSDLAAYAWLRQVLRHGDYDLVHTHSSKAGFLGRRAAVNEGVPALYTPNGWAFLNPEFTVGRRRLFAAAERAAARWGRRILAVSAGEAEAAQRWGIAPREQVQVIRNGINLAELDRLTRGIAPQPGAYHVVTVGRRVEQKGDRVLLTAWARVLAERPDARLTLVGDGPLEPSLRRLTEQLGIAHAVTFAGRVEGAARVTAAADVFVLPSLFEGCPYALMEAMALGRPCVASDIPGCRDLVEDEVTGQLVSPRNPEMLAAELLRLGDDEAMRARLGQAARQWARRHLDVREMVAAVARVYREVGHAVA